MELSKVLKQRIARQACGHRNRANQEGVPYPLTVAEWTVVLQSAEGCCYHCGQVVGIDHLVLDHLIPLTGGGPHAKENAVPSCAICNLRKGNKQIDGSVPPSRWPWEKQPYILPDLFDVEQERRKMQQWIIEHPDMWTFLQTKREPGPRRNP